MGKAPITNGVAYVHVGTHKTGTTSIQALLSMNDGAFREAGVYVPRTGRVEPSVAAHHNIAWELAGDPQFDPQRGTFDGLLCEVASANARNVCITSEEFEFLHLNDVALLRLRDGFRAIGYEPHVIVYLRPQCDYLESLYAEISRAWNIDFSDFLETIIATRLYGQSRFDYDRLVGAFADVFGCNRTLVRTYRSSAPAAKLLREFTHIIAPHELEFGRLTLPGRLNPMASFPDVVAARERQLSCAAYHSMATNQRFDPLGLIDILRLVVRFTGSNERIARRYGVHIGCVTPATLVREAITELFRDRESRYRKRLIRALVEGEADIAA